jgi:hypothetical protein
MTTVADAERVDIPAEITLPADTMQRLMDDPDLIDAVDAAREEGGTAGLIAFLDAHGLRWRAGGSFPADVLADGVVYGGLECEGELFEPGGMFAGIGFGAGFLSASEPFRATCGSP